MDNEGLGIPQLDKADKDLVRRKIHFEDELQLQQNAGRLSPNQTPKLLGVSLRIRDAEINLEDDDDDKHMKLKRLFKSRAKKLIERAESLTANQFENILGDYSLGKEEEEKEIKIPKSIGDKKIASLKPTKTSNSQGFGIEIGISDQDAGLAANLIATKEKEDKKGDTNDEEFKKSREENHMCCGVKRPRVHHSKEEFERSLKDFTCTICMDYMVGAKKLQCGHWFCDQCISFWFLREKVCPICRDKIRDEKNTECSLIDFTIEHILTRAYQRDASMLKELKSWQGRRDKYHKWRESHRLKNVKIGDKVDVRDTEYIWWTGWVEKILKSKYNCADLLYIHYDGWSRCYDEYIPADSDRVSPLTLYTGRNDIPKYTRHEGPDDRVYGNVIEGGDQQREANIQRNNLVVNNNDNLPENSAADQNQEDNSDAGSPEEDKDDEDDDDGDDSPPINLPVEPRTNNASNIATGKENTSN